MGYNTLPFNPFPPSTEQKGNGGTPYTLPIASAETLGGVKVGSGLSINSETGALSYTLPTASAETLGGVKVGSGLSINSETGALSYTLPTASVETKGGVKVGDDLKITDDTLSVDVEIETMEANTYEFELAQSGGDDVTKKKDNTVISTEHVGTTANYSKNFDGRFVFAFDVTTTGNFTVTLLKPTTDAPAGTVYTWRHDYYPSMPNKKLVFNAETDSGTASEEIQKIYNRVPPAPTTDGIYNLQVTVTSGTPTYSWVSTT